MNKNLKTICKKLGGRWTAKTKTCSVKLTDLTYDSDSYYFYITLGDTTITINSYDYEADGSNPLNIDLSTPRQRELWRKAHGLPRGSAERQKTLEKIRREHLNLLNLFEKIGK